MADANTVSAGLATLGGAGWTPTNDPRYGGSDVLWRSTWANRPVAGSIAVGQRLLVTDIGVGAGLMFSWDGARWVPFCPQILGRSGVAASVTGTVAETALATVTVPAGALGLNGGLRIESCWSYTNSANNKALRIRFGGIGGASFLSIGQTASQLVVDSRRIRNRNSASSQVGSAGSATTATTFGGTQATATSAIDTTAAVDLVLSGTLTSVGETITLENYEVWIHP